MNAHTLNNAKVRTAMSIIREAYHLAFDADLSAFQSIEVESLLRRFAQDHHETFAEVSATRRAAA
jgi:hypothetical protein